MDSYESEQALSTARDRKEPTPHQNHKVTARSRRTLAKESRYDYPPAKDCAGHNLREGNAFSGFGQIIGKSFRARRLWERKNDKLNSPQGGKLSLILPRARRGE